MGTTALYVFSREFFKIINRCWILSKVFLHLLRWLYGFSIWLNSIQLPDVMYHIDWFVDTEKSLDPWNKFHLIMVYDLFNVLLDLVLLIFCWGFLCLYSSVIGGHAFLFCGLFAYGWWWPPRISLRVFHPLHFWEQFQKDRC